MQVSENPNKALFNSYVNDVELKIFTGGLSAGEKYGLESALSMLKDGDLERARKIAGSIQETPKQTSNAQRKGNGRISQAQLAGWREISAEDIDFSKGVVTIQVFT